MIMSSSITTASLLLFLISSIATDDTSASPTVYEALESYGFPVGLLPKGVTSYDLDRSTGKFSVYFNKTCSFSIQGYDLKYKTTVTGTISTNKIEGIKGIQVKVLFIWINVVEVTREGDDIYFSVGILSTSFPTDNFYECPQCGCGFDCNDSSLSETIATY